MLAVSHEAGGAIDSDLAVLSTLAYLEPDMSVEHLMLKKQRLTVFLSRCGIPSKLLFLRPCFFQHGEVASLCL